jgi:hypothetical protein
MSGRSGEVDLKPEIEQLEELLGRDLSNWKGA